MQRVLGFLAIYNILKNKRGIITKTKKHNRGKINWPPQYINLRAKTVLRKKKGI
jgi:hypothetical protein